MTGLRQKGLSTVEFAVVAVVLFVMIFGVFEVARGYYVYAMLDEVTRRASRLAAVCPINDPAISQMAIFNPSGDTSDSALVGDLAPGNVVIDYLDMNAGVVANPTTAAGFAQIRYVRARIVGYQHSIIVPFVAGIGSVQMPQFQSILPRESLGIPREGAITPC
jgi:hypothetical protein